MELLLNELSLSGQYISIEEFTQRGIPPILEIFKILSSEDEIYKSYNFYDCKVTPQDNIHTVLTGPQTRMYDEIRRFKIYLSKLFDNPYWEDAPKHNAEIDYYLGSNSVSATSIAEACERDRMIISFNHYDYTDDKLKIKKIEEDLELYNLKENKDFLEACRVEKIIDFSLYCNGKFNNKSKLNFTSIDRREGFALLLSKSDEELFLSGFEKFDQLSWQEISVDDGLDFKEYDKKNFYNEIKAKKHKFRISQKYRCFGYVEAGIFNVLCFDLTHKRSD